MNKQEIIKNKLRTKIRTLVETVMNESSGMLDINEAKAALAMINAMSSASDGMRYQTNDKGLKDLSNKVSDLRVEIMRYVEDHSQYTFLGKSPNGFRLVKKGKY